MTDYRWRMTGRSADNLSPDPGVIHVSAVGKRGARHLFELMDLLGEQPNRWLPRVDVIKIADGYSPEGDLISGDDLRLYLRALVERQRVDAARYAKEHGLPVPNRKIHYPKLTLRNRHGD